VALSRRRFVTRSAATLGAAALAGVLAACGAPTATAPARPAASPQPVTPAAAVTSPSIATGATTAASGYGPDWKLAAPARIAVIHSGALIQAPLFVARERGLFERFNLDVSLETGNAAEVGPLMARGEIKAVATGLSAATLNLVDRDPNAYLFIAANSVIPPDGVGSVGLLARKDLYDSGQITTVADLKGRRLGVAALWDGLAYSTGALLQEGGLGFGDVERVELGSYPAVLAALKGESIEAAAVFEPLLSAAVAQGLGVVVSQKAAPGLQETFLWANRDWATQERDQAVAFLAGIVLAQRELNGKGFLDSQLAPIVEGYTKLTAGQLQQMAKPAFARNAEINAADMARYQDFFLAAPGKPLGYAQPLDLGAQVDRAAIASALQVVGRE